MRLHELNFAYFSVSCAVVTQILHRNEWQFEREYNSVSPPFFHLLWGRILPKKNFNFLKAEFFCANEIFLVFSVSCAVQTQILGFNLRHFEREFNSASPPFLLLLWSGTFYKKNFHFLEAESVCTNEIFLIFQFLVRLRHKFSIGISDSFEREFNSASPHFLLLLSAGTFYKKNFHFRMLNPSAAMKFSLFFSFLSGWDTNSPWEWVTVWKRIQFCISSFSSSTLSRNFL